jgi:hypothetical protein
VKNSDPLIVARGRRVLCDKQMTIINDRRLAAVLANAQGKLGNYIDG